MPANGEFRGYMIFVRTQSLLFEVWARNDREATLTAAAHAWMILRAEDHEER